MRLNKYIASAGVASRRKADELTAQGKVKVNGVVMSEMGYDVVQGDVVEVNGIVIKPETKMVYVVLNKPRGYITTVQDQQGRPTVMELVRDIDARLFPIGRLDGDTSGMLLLTNDGDMAYRLTHPKHKIFKTYKARVNGVLSDEKLAKLRKGVDIGGYVTAKSYITVIKQASGSTTVEIKISEGKNRQIRKMFASVGNKVIELERTAIGELRMGRLKEGHYRKLTLQEIEYLKDC